MTSGSAHLHPPPPYVRSVSAVKYADRILVLQVARMSRTEQSTYMASAGCIYPLHQLWEPQVYSFCLSISAAYSGMKSKRRLATIWGLSVTILIDQAMGEGHWSEIEPNIGCPPNTYAQCLMYMGFFQSGLKYAGQLPMVRATRGVVPEASSHSHFTHGKENSLRNMFRNYVDIDQSI